MRAYLPADARCKQLERLVRECPGERVGELAVRAGIAYDSAKAYLRRLVREGRVRAEREAPALPRGSTQRLYPAELPAAARKAA